MPCSYWPSNLRLRRLSTPGRVRSPASSPASSTTTSVTSTSVTTTSGVVESGVGAGVRLRKSPRRAGFSAEASACGVWSGV